MGDETPLRNIIQRSSSATAKKIWVPTEARLTGLHPGSPTLASAYHANGSRPGGSELAGKRSGCPSLPLVFLAPTLRSASPHRRPVRTTTNRDVDWLEIRTTSQETNLCHHMHDEAWTVESSSVCNHPHYDHV